MALAFDNILRHVSEVSPVDAEPLPRDIQAAEGSWRGAFAEVPEVEETSEVSKNTKLRKHQKRSSSSSQQQRHPEQQQEVQHEQSKKKQSSKKAQSSPMQERQEVPRLDVRDQGLQQRHHELLDRSSTQWAAAAARDLGPVAEPPRLATPPQPSPPPSQRGPAAAAAAAAVAAAASGGSRGSAESGGGGLSPPQRLASPGVSAASTSSEWKRSKSEQRVRKNLPQQLSPLLSEQESAAAASAAPSVATKSAMLRSSSHSGFPAPGAAKAADAQAKARRTKLMADLAFHEQQLAGLKGKPPTAATANGAARPGTGSTSSPLLRKTFQNSMQKGARQSPELPGEGIEESAAGLAASEARQQQQPSADQPADAAERYEDAEDDPDDDDDEWSRDPSGFCFLEDFSVDNSGIPSDPQRTDAKRPGPETPQSNLAVADGDWPDNPLDAEFPEALLDYDVIAGNLSPDLQRTTASGLQVLQEDAEEDDGEDEDEDEDDLDGVPSALAQSSFARSPQSSSQPLQQPSSQQVSKPSLSPLTSSASPSSSSSQPFDPFKPFQGKPKSKTSSDYKPLPSFEVSGNIEHLFGLLNPGNPTLSSNRLSDPGLHSSNRLSDPGKSQKQRPQGLEDPGWPKRDAAPTHGVYASMSTAAPRRSFLEEVGAWSPEDDVEPVVETSKRDLYPVRKPTLAKIAKEEESKAQKKKDVIQDRFPLQISKKRPDEAKDKPSHVSFDTFDEDDDSENEEDEDKFGVRARNNSSWKDKESEGNKPTLDYRTTYTNMRGQHNSSEKTVEEKNGFGRQSATKDMFPASGSSNLTNEDGSEAKDTEELNGFRGVAKRSVDAKPIHAWESPKGAASRDSPTKIGVVKVVKASPSGAGSPGSAPPPLPSLPASLFGGLGGAAASPPPMPALPSSLISGPGAHKKGSSLF